MKRFASPALVAAPVLALVLAARPTPAGAAAMTDGASAQWQNYRLTIQPGAAPVGQVTFNPVAEGTFLLAGDQGSPVRLDRSSFAGFDPQGLQVLLGHGAATGSTPAQEALAFDFGPGMFHPDGSTPGTLDFALAVAPGTAAGVLTLPPVASNLSILPVAAPSPPPGTPDSPSVPQEIETPEPLSLALWAAGAAGLGLARPRRRARPGDDR